MPGRVAAPNPGPSGEQASVTESGRETLLAGIPTSDPDAALRFCRLLAELLGADRGPSAAEASAAPEARPELSVVVPVYNEADNVPVLYARLTAVLQSAGPDHEIVFVDDGSRDGSPAVLQGLAARDPHIVLVELARNFGHQVAISAGLENSRGKGVIVMDADLQDPPEVLPQLIAKWREGHDVVYAIKEQRKEGWF